MKKILFIFLLFTSCNTFYKVIGATDTSLDTVKCYTGIFTMTCNCKDTFQFIKYDSADAITDTMSYLDTTLIISK